MMTIEHDDVAPVALDADRLVALDRWRARNDASGLAEETLSEATSMCSGCRSVRRPT